VLAEVVGSNHPTRSTFINLVDYGIVEFHFLTVVGKNVLISSHYNKGKKKKKSDWVPVLQKRVCCCDYCSLVIMLLYACSTLSCFFFGRNYLLIGKYFLFSFFCSCSSGTLSGIAGCSTYCSIHAKHYHRTKRLSRISRYS
jgi:hypothetical protein